jgi:NAD(P)-dependent dehydrogenase (short-subunit alcohol dehydrogenase family)
LDSTGEKWALILGASSGFGAASAIALADEGFHIIGVHFDRKSTIANADEIAGRIRAAGREAAFFNVNAADAERRAEIVDFCKRRDKPSPADAGIHVVLHSLAFGSLKLFVSADRDAAIKPADMTMTLDVMAHSLVYWVQDLFAAGLLPRSSQVLAMTSAGGHRVWHSYGAVSAAKAALESHVRQLAVELAPFGIAVNALRAGVTDTPAARKIPESEQMFARARQANPAGRLTTPEDVARVVVALSVHPSPWLTGNVLGIDGGEDLAG